MTEGNPRGTGGTATLALRAGLFALLWWILAEGRLDAWWLGAVGVAAATWASLRLAPPGALNIRVVPLLRFLAFFVWNSLRGGAQVAFMALRPRPDLAPALLELELVLPPGTPRVLMLNTLGLMPGTLGVRLDAATLRLHVLDARLPVAAEARALEAHIARLFGAAA
ncbi:MAG: Na+/H+ antiporter subunit E [Rhodocyclaceae bacterium]|nr:Na+/H+ antiporter subunit E [Rhodocyclaceae bacterium]